MLAELNRMVERRERGADVQADFDQFMERYGDLVPGHPADLDELLASLARQMAAARALLAPSARSREPSWPSSPRRSWRAMRLYARSSRSSSVTWKENQPTRTCSGCPSALGRPTPPRELSDLDQLEQLLAGAPSPGALAEVDIDRARSCWGGRRAVPGGAGAAFPPTARVRSGGAEGRAHAPNPAGPAPHRDQALADLYTRLQRYRSGQHPWARQAAAMNGPARQSFTSGATLQPVHPAHRPQRSGAARPGHARPAVTGGLRDRADRGADALGDGDHARPVAIDAMRGTSSPQEDDNGFALAHIRPFPFRLPRDSGFSRSAGG